MEKLNRKGIGYSIEAILSAVILFTFAFGAVTPPETQEFSKFQNELAARDLTHMIKKTGDLDVFLKNSNTGGIRSELSSVSSKNLKASGTVSNLPVGETEIAFHTMPYEVHVNGTEPVEPGDRCEGDLASLDASSEEPILRANVSQELVNRHSSYLYFGDSDPLNPSGYNGKEDYDIVWVDNGTKCVFSPSEGPYRINDIFLWGNSSDPDSRYYEFKNINASKGQFTVYEADNAFDVKKMMNRELNGINTDTVVNTVNLSSPDIYGYDVMVFQENETVPRFNTYRNLLRDVASNTSMLLMMNMTQSDAQNSFVRDLGFKWTPMDYNSVNSYRATFSAYGNSDNIESYFLGLGGDQRDLSLKPGGKIISNQGSRETSRDDILYARNTLYNGENLDFEQNPPWNTGYSGPNTCGTDDKNTSFSANSSDYSTESVDVRIFRIGTSSCSSPYAMTLDLEQDGNFEIGPVLEDEIFEAYGRRYSPRFTSSNDAYIEFVGSKKVELINHRKALENISGAKAARMAYESDYEEDDLKMVASTIYWLRDDNVRFESTDQSSYTATKIVGGVENRLFLPYRLDLRWSR
ncbi:hypothetical protein GLT92_00485 [Nanohaloarchaea archaeon]|nr:hypothetical protein [Candidatus Nanohaloarchaea archaeon]